MKNLKSYINFIIGILVFVAFVLINLITVKFGAKPFLDVLLYSGLMFVCWILIKNAFAEQGLLNGQKDPEVIKTKKEHLLTSIEVNNHKKKFNQWCDLENKERLKTMRQAILGSTSLSYDDFFDKDGNIINKEVEEPAKPELTPNKKVNRQKAKEYKKKLKIYKRDCRMLEKAQMAYVAPYKPDEIIEIDKVDNEKNLFGVSIKKWKNIKLVMSVVASLIICVMLAFVETSDKTLTQDEQLILIFQLLIMIGSACSFYFSSVNFICSDWRSGIIKKIKIMDAFYRTQIGTISYERDKKLEDGTIIMGGKIFTPKVVEGEEKCQKETLIT